MSAQDQPTGDEWLMGRLVELGVKHEAVQRVDELFAKLRELDRNFDAWVERTKVLLDDT